MHFISFAWRVWSPMDNFPKHNIQFDGVVISRCCFHFMWMYNRSNRHKYLGSGIAVAMLLSAGTTKQSWCSQWRWWWRWLRGKTNKKTLKKMKWTKANTKRINNVISTIHIYEFFAFFSVFHWVFSLSVFWKKKFQYSVGCLFIYLYAIAFHIPY